MAYFPDLTSYEYFKANSRDTLLNVGWLDDQHPFPVGEPDLEIVLRLGQISKQRVNRPRGFHMCPFCSQRELGLLVEIDHQKTKLGSAEVRVQGNAGISYACPDLVYHYIKDHHYNPPEEFLRAVRSSTT